MIKVKDGLYYAAKKADPTPEPEPEKKFDLSVESIKVTPNSNSINGDVKASVTIKNNGTKQQIIAVYDSFYPNITPYTNHINIYFQQYLN